MKKLIQATLLLLAVILILSACQPTPQSSAVANKGNTNLEEDIQKTAEPSQTGAVKEKNEKKWTYEKNYDSGNRLTVDAVMYHTDEGKLPVLSVAQKMFESGDWLKTITGVLYGGADTKIYDQGDKLTKSQLTKSIMDVKEEIFKVENNMIPYEGAKEPIPEDHKGSYLSTLNSAMADYEKQMETAPDDSALKEASYKLTKEEDHSLQSNMLGTTKDSSFSIDFVNWPTDRPGSEVDFESNKLIFENVATTDKLVMPEDMKDDAEFVKEKERIDQSVKDMGIDYMSLNTVCKGNNSYSFYYTRAYNSLQETYIENYIGTTVTGVDYGPEIYLWKPEYLYFEVQNGEIVKARWNNPSQITKTDNENVKAKTWEEIQDIFKKQMDYMMSPKPADSSDDKQTTVFSDKTEVHINRVELGLTKVLMKNSKDDYKLIPTWNFMGYETSASRPAENGVNRGAEVCFVTINAIDGTVIDRGLMY